MTKPTKPRAEASVWIVEFDWRRNPSGWDIDAESGVLLRREDALFYIQKQRSAELKYRSVRYIPAPRARRKR